MSNPEVTTQRNRFEFITVASARARQLQRGCTPRVEGGHTVARVAAREVAEGLVERVADEHAD